MWLFAPVWVDSAPLAERGRGACMRREEGGACVRREEVRARAQRGRACVYAQRGRGAHVCKSRANHLLFSLYLVWRGMAGVVRNRHDLFSRLC